MLKAGRVGTAARLVAMIAGGMALVPAAATAAVLNDGGFEAQAAASGRDYCYFFATAGGRGPCASGAWTGENGGGLQIETNQPWPGVPSPDGNYYGFVQGLGSLSQTFSVAASGNYLFSWLDAGRPLNGSSQGNQTYAVTLTDLTTSAVTNLFGGATTNGSPWTARSSGALLSTGTQYRLTFTGQAISGDQTAFIDAVSVAAVPEPATWMMMMAGFGVAAFALRRRPAMRTVAA